MQKTLKILISSLRQSFEAPIVTHFYHEFILKLDNRIRLLVKKTCLKALSTDTPRQ